MSNKKVLITGISGQDGSYLAELLLEKGYEVFGLYRRSATPKFDNILHIKDKIHLVCGDLTDPVSINNIIASSAFDEVYNLAAQSFVGESFKQPSLTIQIDTIGVLNLLEAIRMYSPKTRFYQASTSEMFGSNYSTKTLKYDERNEPEEVERFQNEDTPFRPESPYAVAKVAAHHLCQLYRKAYGLHISCGILFNHESPRRGLEFVTRKITDYVARFYRHKELAVTTIKPELSTDFPKLKLGNLDAYRDWGHAKDFVYGMYLMLQQDTPDDYVLCTEKTHNIRDFLTAAFNAAGFASWEVEQDPQFMRPSEVPYLKGSYTKARTKLGWTPSCDFKDLVAEMVKKDIARYSNV